MNILIPHTWLLEHLETSASISEIQKYLSLSGPSVERIYDIEGESVYDIEVTTNRVDSMSVRGIAREAAVILTEAGIPSKLKNVRKGSFDFAQDDKAHTLPLPKIHNNPKFCKRILCVAIADVKKTSSPDWMQKRLRQIGVNTHDEIIDITNYITHELGHPCHAFDYDKIMKTGGVINVVEAKKGQKFAIIDGTTFETVGGEIVFENNAGEIIDLPAIKGTANTAIDDSTKNVLFWIESLDAKKVRFASMTHAIRTVAAQLNEKNVDPELGEDVLTFGTQLLCEHAGGKVASEVFDEYTKKTQTSEVRCQVSVFQQYLGIELPLKKIVSILESLGCSVSVHGKDSHTELVITAPSFRPDLEIPADIVEEVARIYGYHNLPSTLMSSSIPTDRPLHVDFDLEYEVKQFLATLGAYEVYTYSMIDEKTKDVERKFIGSTKDDTHIKLKNPLTDDMMYLRRTLWASHLNVLAENPTPKDACVFEFANNYIPTEFGSEDDREERQASHSKDSESKILPFEEYHLTLTGRGDERSIKGMIEGLAKKYYLPELRYVPSKTGMETDIFADKTRIGYFLQNPNSKIQNPMMVIDIEWKKFLSLVRKYPLYKSESKFTPVTEDLTFTIPEGQQIQRVLETIKQSDLFVTHTTLKDLYKRNATFSLAYESDHQLEATEVSKIRKKIVTNVTNKHQGILVGNLE